MYGPRPKQEDQRQSHHRSSGKRSWWSLVVRRVERAQFPVHSCSEDRAIGTCQCDWVGLEQVAMREAQEPRMVLALKEGGNVKLWAWDRWCPRQKNVSVRRENGAHVQGSKSNWDLSVEWGAKGKKVGDMVGARVENARPKKMNFFLQAIGSHHRIWNRLEDSQQAPNG